MSHPDEESRLAGHYAAMTAEQLLAIWEDSRSLTDLARQQLAAEILLRGLPLGGVAGEPASTEIEYRDLVTLRQFRDLPEALFARGLLESAGIECFLADENIVRMDWFVSNLVGGVKLKVKPDDLDAANLVLQQPPQFDSDSEN